MRLDHIVIKTDNLEEAMNIYSRAGFTVVRGGEHKKHGSHNALIAFDDGVYLELIAFKGEWTDITKRPTEQSANPNASRPEKIQIRQQAGYSRIEWRLMSWRDVTMGLLDYALMPDADFDQLRQRQLDIKEPLAVERDRPDGQTVKWEMGFPDQTDLPFFIWDTTPRDLRVPLERTHENGVTGISELVIIVNNLESSTKRYEQLLTHSPLEHTSEALPHSDCVAFPCGTTNIILVQPKDNEALQTHLIKRGESIWSLSLTTNNSAIKGIPPEELCGARIHFSS